MHVRPRTLELQTVVCWEVRRIIHLFLYLCATAHLALRSRRRQVSSGPQRRGRVLIESRRYAGHYYWGMNVNALCNRPRGRLNLYGTSERVTYAFKLVRKNAGGREVVTSFAVDAYQADDASAASMEEEDPWAKDSKAVYGDGVAQIMVAAPGDE